MYDISCKNLCPFEHCQRRILFVILNKIRKKRIEHRSKEMEDKEYMEQQTIIKGLQEATILYIFVSGCTRGPYVQCDPETMDDETMIFMNLEDAKKEGDLYLQDKIPINIAKLEKKQMLGFYTSLYTMGINAILVVMGDRKRRIQLKDFVKRKKMDGQEGGWIENPALHLTSLYYMQEIRRKPEQGITEKIKELQEEIEINLKRGGYLLALRKDGEEIPLVKGINGEVFQPIFTDLLEFQKFNRENKLQPMVVLAENFPQVFTPKAKGIVLNPMGVNMPLSLRRVEQT